MSENSSIPCSKSPEEKSTEAEKIVEPFKIMIANEQDQSQKALLGAIDLENRIEIYIKDSAKMIALVRALEARYTLLKARMQIMECALMEENKKLLKIIRQ